MNKVMQVEETVYEEKVKCTHKFSEKCHDTFITDYVPTQEKKCETSFEKNCHITYKPMVRLKYFSRTIQIFFIVLYRCSRRMLRSVTSR